jgi:hypothetical protein
MNEGTVVIVTGKFDERVRKNEENNIIGTLVKIDSENAWVMLPDGNIWVGKKYLVYPIREEEECTTN